jgi:hypothetical protein
MNQRETCSKRERCAQCNVVRLYFTVPVVCAGSKMLSISVGQARDFNLVLGWITNQQSNERKNKLTGVKIFNNTQYQFKFHQARAGVEK